MRSINKCVLGIVFGLSAAGMANGAVTETDTPSVTSETTFPATASDQVDQSQTSTFLSQTTSGFTNGFGSGGPTRLNDGSLGSGNTLTDTTISLTDWTTTFHLKTTVNTSGYDLLNIKTIAAWPDNRVDQKYSVYYSTVSSNPSGDDSTGYSLLKDVSYIPHPGGPTNSQSSTGGNSTQVELQVSGVSGVNSVQFRITGVPVSGVGGDVETVYREFDILANPTAVPEPASLAICAAAGIALLTRRRSHRGR